MYSIKSTPGSSSSQHLTDMSGLWVPTTFSWKRESWGYWSHWLNPRPHRHREASSGAYVQLCLNTPWPWPLCPRSPERSLCHEESCQIWAKFPHLSESRGSEGSLGGHRTWLTVSHLGLSCLLASKLQAFFVHTASLIGLEVPCEQAWHLLPSLVFLKPLAQSWDQLTINSKCLWLWAPFQEACSDEALPSTTPTLTLTVIVNKWLYNFVRVSPTRRQAAAVSYTLTTRNLLRVPLSPFIVNVWTWILESLLLLFYLPSVQITQFEERISKVF